LLFFIAAWTIAVLALGLRFFELGRFSLWIDEVRSLIDSDTLHRALLDSYHPPASYVILWAFRQLFGDGNLAVRAPSALAGTGTVVVVMLLARRLGAGRVGAVAAGLLLAIAPAAVGLAREARMYPLLMLACTLTVLALDAYLRAPSPTRGLVGGLAMAFALSVHAYGALFTAPAIVCALLARRDTPLGERASLLVAPLVTGVALVARIAFRPLDHVEAPLSFAARHVAGDGISPLTAAGRLIWYRPWAFELSDPFIVGGGALLLGALLAGAFARGAAVSRAQRVVALSSLVVAPTMIAALPLNSAVRLFSPALPLAIAVAMAGVAALPRRWARIAVAVVLAGAAVTTLPFLREVYVLELEPWLGVCERVRAQPGPVLISARYMAPAYRRCAPPSVILAYPDDDLDAETAVARVASSDTVWLIASHTTPASSDAIDGDADRRAARALAKTHAPVHVESLSPILRIEKYVRRPSPRDPHR
jgi:4-amino-4-deoxy-L-arabinose transferase-like glycosyltransferase